jgi:hypothetical protein
MHSLSIASSLIRLGSGGLAVGRTDAFDAFLEAYLGHPTGDLAEL